MMTIYSFLFVSDPLRLLFFLTNYNSEISNRWHSSSLGIREGSTPGRENSYGIIESFRLEKTFKIKSNR